MTGVVRGREARLKLTVRGPSGTQQTIAAVIDTGFTGSLTLPPSRIAALNLRWRNTGRGILADGSECLFNVYEATVVWNRRACTIFVSEAESVPLIGMTLLDGFELNVQVRPGGKVTIRPLPDGERSSRQRR